jgi:NYN domain
MAQGFIELKPTIDPHLRRWMLFVDGENLTLRAQELAQDKRLLLTQGPAYVPDVYVWIPGVQPTQNIVPGARLSVQGQAIRAYYYTSLVGDEQRILAVREALYELGFSPEVFKKSRQGTKAKGVDIALARDILGHAYRDNHDVAVLMAGDRVRSVSHRG